MYYKIVLSKRGLLAAAIIATAFSASGRQVLDLAQYVDMNIGNDDGVRSPIGPFLPHGSLQGTPVTTNPNGVFTMGCVQGEPINGFSQLICEGAGWCFFGGNITIYPEIGLDINRDSRASDYSNETATVNSYSVTLNKSNIQVHSSPTHNCNLYEFSFPSSDQAYVTMDMAYSPINVYKFDGVNWDTVSNTLSDGLASIDAAGRTISGYCQYQGTYTVYFYMEFAESPAGYGAWGGGAIKDGVTSLSYQQASGTSMGCYFKFNTSQNNKVHMKIGISFQCVDKAKSFVQNELLIGRAHV
jgi:putative alpha-1,2-mannosidase